MCKGTEENEIQVEGTAGNEIHVAGYIPQDDLRDEAEAFLKFVLSRGKYIAESIGANPSRDEQSVVANRIFDLAESARSLLDGFWGWRKDDTQSHMETWTIWNMGVPNYVGAAKLLEGEK